MKTEGFDLALTELLIWKDQMNAWVIQVDQRLHALEQAVAFQQVNLQLGFERIEKILEEHHDMLEYHSQKFEAVETELKRLNQKSEATDKKISQMDEKISQMDGKINEIDTKVNQIQDVLTEILKRLPPGSQV